MSPLRPPLPLDAEQLERWSRFAARGGIGRGIATTDREARQPHELMFMQGDHIVCLLDWDKGQTHLAWCEGVIGLVHLEDLKLMGPLKKASLVRKKSEQGISRPSTESSDKQTPAVPPGKHLQPTPQPCRTPPPLESPTSLLDLYDSSPNKHPQERERTASRSEEAGHSQASQKIAVTVTDEADVATPRPSTSQFAAAVHNRPIKADLNSGGLASSLRYQQQQQQRAQASLQERQSPSALSTTTPETAAPASDASTREEDQRQHLSRSISYESNVSQPAQDRPVLSRSKAPAAHVAPWMRSSVSTTTTFSSFTTNSSDRDLSDSSTPGSTQFSSPPPPQLKSKSSRQTVTSQSSPMVSTKRGDFEMMMPAANRSSGTLDTKERTSLWSDTSSIFEGRRSSSSRPRRKSPADVEAVHLHREKESAWISIFAKWNSARDAPTSKLFKHAKRGIPSSVRFRAWVFLTNGTVQPHAFNALLDRPEELPSEHACIENDLMRYCTSSSLFEAEDSPSREDIALLLHAYSQQSPGNYKPSLIYLARACLLHSPPEPAFALLSTIVNEKLPLLYGNKASSMEMSFILRELLRKHDVQMLARLQEEEGGLAQIIQLWLAPLFLNGVIPTDSALRVLDIVLVESESERFLIQVALALLDLCRNAVMDRSQRLLLVLQKPPQHLTSSEAVLSSALAIKIKSSRIDKLARQAAKHNLT